MDTVVCHHWQYSTKEIGPLGDIYSEICCKELASMIVGAGQERPKSVRQAVRKGRLETGQALNCCPQARFLLLLQRSLC